MAMNKRKLLESKLRQMIREELVNEGPNADAQKRIVKSIKDLCDNFLNGTVPGLTFVKNVETEMRDFKRTTGGR